MSYFVKACDHCKAVNHPSDKQCRNCDGSLVWTEKTESDDPPPAPQQPRRASLLNTTISGKEITAYIASALLIVFAIGYWQSQPDPPATSTHTSRQAGLTQSRQERPRDEKADREKRKAYERDLAARRAYDGMKNLQPVIEEWHQTMRIAEVTPRIALTGPVQRLMDIRRRTAGIEAHECAADVKQALLAMMDAANDAILDAMADRNLSAAERRTKSASEQFSKATNDCRDQVMRDMK